MTQPSLHSLHPPVDFLSVSHLYDEDQERLVPNLVDHAVVLPRTGVDAPEFLFRFQFLDSMRTRVLLQAEDVPSHWLSDAGIELAEVSLGGRSDFDTVGQDSISKFPHKIPKGGGPLHFRFLQRGSSVFEIDPILFLPGQALQEIKIFDRDDSGKILPAAGDNSALLRIGRAVYDFREFFPRFRNV